MESQQKIWITNLSFGWKITSERKPTEDESQTYNTDHGNSNPRQPEDVSEEELRENT